eukprot:m.296747 g.296747  ORF g.296747 m.296747 type:complete len:335 (+) comp16393_c7_seq1:415-1419(+)
MSSRGGVRQRKGGKQNPYRNLDTRYEGTADEEAAKQRARAQSGNNNDGEPSIVDIVSEYVTKIASELKNAITKFFKSRKVEENTKIPPSEYTRTALEIIDSKAAAQFQEGNPDHEAMLVELWSLLQPDVPFERKSKNWSDIGFQGKDPATDFRGQGLLGLQNFLFMARTENQRTKDMLLRPHGGFPLAIAVINISAFLKQLLKKYDGHIGNSLFDGVSNSTDVLAIFDELFIMIFINFEEVYSNSISKYLAQGGKPEFTIMQFNPIREEYFKSLEAKVAKGFFEESFTRPARKKSLDSSRRVPTNAAASSSSPANPSAPTETEKPKEENLISFD